MGGLNERVKKLNVVDISFIKLAVFFATIIIVKVFPQLLNIRLLALLIIVVGFSIIPFYKFWIKKA